MYNNGYGQEQYLRQLQNLKNEAEQRIQQVMSYQGMQQIPSINQTFQLATNQSTNNEFDGKTVRNIDDVKNTLAFKTTLFINENKNMLWIKDASGAIKTYSMQEVVELDEKDKIILELQKQLEELKGANNDAKNDNKYVIGQPAKQKSTNVSANIKGNE